VFLLMCTLSLAFTGQVMRFDQDAYWGLSIGTAILGRIPLVGAGLVHLVLAGPIIAGETLSRFFTLHVFIIPGLIIAFISLHLRLVLTKGINEYPKPGHKVRRTTYDAEYADLIRREGVPFVPRAIGKDLIFSAIVLVLILGFALALGPKGPKGIPNPTLVDTSPRPDFYFLSIFAALALLPNSLETIVMFIAPGIVLLILFILPFISNTGEKSAARRPLAVLWVVLIVLTIVTLAYYGETSPWSPHMDAWSADPVPIQFIRGRTPLQIHGALVFQNKQCRNCHSLGGHGGERGPALDRVATRLTRDEMTRQVIQGGGNMPAYGKKLTPAEVEALIDFMETLRPQSTPPSKNAAPPQNKLPRDFAVVMVAR